MTGIAFVYLLVALLYSTALLLLVLAAMWWFDRYEHEPVYPVVAVFLWGSTAAPAAAIFAGSRIFGGFSSGVADVAIISGTSVFTMSMVAELTKAAGVLFAVLLTRRFDSPVDGIVYGTAVGLGFAVTETTLYGLGLSITSQPSSSLIFVVGQTVLVAGIHVLSSSVFGGFLGVAYLDQGRLKRFVWTLIGFLAAVTIHSSCDPTVMNVGSSSNSGQNHTWLIVVPVLYVTYLLTIVGFFHSEHRILKAELAEEVEFALVPTWVGDVIPYYRRRVRGDWWPSRSERTVIARLLTRLAFRKHALRSQSSQDDAVASLEVVLLRKRVREVLSPEEPSEI